MAVPYLEKVSTAASVQCHSYENDKGPTNTVNLPRKARSSTPLLCAPKCPLPLAFVACSLSGFLDFVCSNSLFWGSVLNCELFTMPCAMGIPDVISLLIPVVFQEYLVHRHHLGHRQGMWILYNLLL